MLTIAGAVVGALASMKFDHGACIALGLVLIGFGVLGTAFSIVQYGKWTQSRERWRKIRDRLDTICVSATIGKLRDDGEDKDEE